MSFCTMPSFVNKDQNVITSQLTNGVLLLRLSYIIYILDIMNVLRGGGMVFNSTFNNISVIS